MNHFHFDRRRALLSGALALALAIGALALIGNFAHYHDVLRALERAGKWWFPLCLVGELLAYTGYILAYRDVARAEHGPELSGWTATRVVVIGFGAFALGASAGGLAFDYWALHRAGEPTHRAARRVLALNTLEWSILATAAALAAVGVLAGAGSGAPLAMELAWLVGVPLAIAAALYTSSPGRVDRFTRIRWLGDAIGGVVLVRHLAAHPRRHYYALLGFVLYWCGDILALYAALRAFGAHIGIPSLVLGYTTAYAVTALPLPAGGAGGVEAGLTFSLNAVGVPLASALVATLVYRFFTLWVPIGPALAFLPQLHKLAEELPKVKRAD